MIQIFDTHSNTLDYYSKEKYSMTSKNICRGKKLYPAIPISYFLKTLTIVLETLQIYRHSKF